VGDDQHHIIQDIKWKFSHLSNISSIIVASSLANIASIIGNKTTTMSVFNIARVTEAMTFALSVDAATRHSVVPIKKGKCNDCSSSTTLRNIETSSSLCSDGEEKLA